MQENCILRAVNFNFLGGACSQTPLVKLVQIRGDYVLTDNVHVILEQL